MTRGRTIVGLAVVLFVAAMGPAGAQGEASTCAAGDDLVVLTGELAESDAETYTLLPVDVAAGTTRVEVGYAWSDVEPGADGDTRSVLDLGIWDADGTEEIGRASWRERV